MYRFFGKTISGPFTIPSGIVTTDPAILEHIAKKVPEIGILTTKSISLNPKAGNRESIYALYKEVPNSFINAVGLTNPGAAAFREKLETIELPQNKFLLISIFGATVKDFYEAAKILFPYANGFELNISCPHAKGYGQAICQDIPLVRAIIKKVKTLGKPVLVKMSPNIDIKKTSHACIQSGVDGFVAINTWGPKSQEHDGHPILANGVGGVSGQAVRDIGIRTVQIIRSLTRLPIIGCGGISTAMDVDMYARAGANYFGIGSALTNMDTSHIIQYFKMLNLDMEKHTHKAEKYIPDLSNFAYHKMRITSVKHLDAVHAIFTFDEHIALLPGQFIFLWIPGIGEKPFSLLDTDPAKVFVKVKGCFTGELMKKKKGDVLYWRGPYGKTIPLKGKTLLVGAGTGIAALYLFSKNYKKTFAILGAKTGKEVVYEKAFRAHSRNVWVTTSQDEKNPKQHVTDKLAEVITKIHPQTILNCGPEQMVHECIAIEKRFVPQKNIFSSIEFVTKCGVGICGSCATKKGQRNCVDGTFFVPSQLQ